jgi:hypothetical protein
MANGVAATTLSRNEAETAVWSGDQHNTLKTPFPKAAHALLPRWDAQAYLIPVRLGRESDGRATTTESCARIVGDGSQIIEIGTSRFRRWSVSPFDVVEERTIENLGVLGALKLIFDIARDGRQVCGTDVNGNVSVCDLNRGTIVHLGGFLYVGAVGCSSNGDRTVVVHGDGVYEYDSHTGQQIRSYSSELATAVRYSADAQRIAIAFEAGHTCTYDTLTGEETLRLDVRASEMLFTRDGTALLTDGAPDGGFYFWPGKK